MVIPTAARLSRWGFDETAIAAATGGVSDLERRSLAAERIFPNLFL